MNKSSNMVFFLFQQFCISISCVYGPRIEYDLGLRGLIHQTNLKIRSDSRHVPIWIFLNFFRCGTKSQQLSRKDWPTNAHFNTIELGKLYHIEFTFYPSLIFCICFSLSLSLSLQSKFFLLKLKNCYVSSEKDYKKQTM